MIHLFFVVSPPEIKLGMCADAAHRVGASLSPWRNSNVGKMGARAIFSLASYRLYDTRSMAGIVVYRTWNLQSM